MRIERVDGPQGTDLEMEGARGVRMSSAVGKPAFLFVLGALMALAASASPTAVYALDTAAVQRLLGEGASRVFLLDVRTPSRSMRRVGSRGLVLTLMDQIRARLSEIPRGRKLVVVRASGARSAAAARYLDQRGFPWMGIYEGGASEWVRRGLPLAH